jgi:hypothetical protein
LKTEKLAFPIKICALILAIWVIFVYGGTTASAPTPAMPSYGIPKTVSKAAVTQELTGTVRPSGTEWKRDPFEHPEEVVSENGRAANGTVLVGIIDGRKGRMAIFGHSIVQKGDSLGNEKILDITEDRVIVTHDGSTRIIAMQEAR